MSPRLMDTVLNVAVVVVIIPVVALAAGLVAWPAVWVWRSVLGL